MTHSSFAINTIDEWGRGAAKNGTTPEAVPVRDIARELQIDVDALKYCIRVAGLKPTDRENC